MLQDVTRSSFNPTVLESSGSFFAPWLQFSNEATATERLERGSREAGNPRNFSLAPESGASVVGTGMEAGG